MKKLSTSHFYSIIGVSLVLFLLGLLGWIIINGRGMNKFLKKNIEVQVIMHDNTQPDKYNALYEILKKQNFIEKAQLITKEQAAEQFAKENDVDFREILDFNPLFTSININLYPIYVNPDSLVKVEQFLKQSNIVREVVYPKPVVSSLNDTINRISLILAVVAGLLLLSVVFLIDNTVRLSMFSNRHTIKTMQMVGATRWFIAKPFDISAIVSGAISAVIASIAIFGLRSLLLSRYPEMYAFEDINLFFGLLLLVLVLGVLISLFSTHRSVYKYLKLKVEDLY
ncbi:MAG TPA: permease-like cell division protein FtsX [Edaphocola sp.]|nr:permease-like cell division protein FtsX [Edaphocola sp.]